MDDPFYNPVEVEVLGLLIGEGVDFVIVGGAAVQYHGYERPREDLDVLIRPSIANALCFANAMARTVPAYPFTSEDLEKIAGGSFEWAPRNAHHSGIHFLGHIGGVTYEEARASAVLAVCRGLQIPILSLGHLIASKRERDEAKDRADIIALGQLV
ncbi:hypothetical protein [Rhizobium leguminosarum]|uniref:hypothetical protein n=1 Tax=Rhizobium leguminosarum TaxID=384 RepID=UPI001C94F423|nr:hypothetical protein [Rhizobium leguminosarum]MBY5417663.1 hypothetical protein [Rhizobium leguminosarum]